MNYWQACIIEKPGVALNGQCLEPMHVNGMLATMERFGRLTTVHTRRDPEYAEIVRNARNLTRYDFMIFHPGTSHGPAQIDGRTVLNMNGSDVLALMVALLIAGRRAELDHVSRLFDYRYQRAVWEWLRTWVYGSGYERHRAAADAGLLEEEWQWCHDLARILRSTK